MSADPVGEHQEDPQTLNKYVYARNNPLSLTDPTGLDFNLTCSGKVSDAQDIHVPLCPALLGEFNDERKPIEIAMHLAN